MAGTTSPSVHAQGLLDPEAGGPERGGYLVIQGGGPGALGSRDAVVPAVSAEGSNPVRRVL